MNLAYNGTGSYVNPNAADAQCLMGKFQQKNITQLTFNEFWECNCQGQVSC